MIKIQPNLDLKYATKEEVAASIGGILGGVDTYADLIAVAPGDRTPGGYIVRNDETRGGNGQLYVNTGTAYNWVILWPYGADDIVVVASGFRGLLSSADTDAQKALETIDSAKYTMSDALRIYNRIKGRKVVFTFSTDDGVHENVDFASVFTAAGYTYTMFLVSDWLNSTHPIYSVPCLTTAELQALNLAGFDLANHSKTHQNLVSLLAGGSINTLVDEIHGAKTAIENLVADGNYICKSFAYPSNARNTELENYVRKYMIGACTGLDADAPDEMENVGMYHAARESIATLIGDGLEATIRANVQSVITNSLIWNVWKHYYWHTSADVTTTQLGWILDEISLSANAAVANVTEMFEYLRYMNYLNTNRILEKIEFPIDGQGFTIIDGQKTPWKIVPFDCQVYGWALRGSASDTFTVDVEYAATISGTPASITGAGVKPNVSAATNGAGTSMTGWTRELTKNGVITVNVSGTPAAATWANLTLFVYKTV